MEITIKLDSLDVIHLLEEMEGVKNLCRSTAEKNAWAARTLASNKEEEQKFRNAYARAMREVEQNQRIIKALERALNS